MNQFSKRASISKGAKIGENVSIWDFAQVRENVLIGTNTIIGSYAYIAANVVIGDNCKIQNFYLADNKLFFLNIINPGSGFVFFRWR